MIQLPVIAFAIAMAGVVPGLYLQSVPRTARLAIPFSGGILLGVSLFGLLPELAKEIGWLKATPVFLTGYLLLLVLGRWAPEEDLSKVSSLTSKDGESRLYGYTLPLAIAAAAHSFLDGWGLASVKGATSDVRLAFPVAVMLHKVPEGLALGAILKSSTGNRWTAFGYCLAVEAATLAGASVGVLLTPRLGSGWTDYPLALAGGCFVYLGWHAIHETWDHQGPRAVMVPALAGLVGAVFLQWAARFF